MLFLFPGRYRHFVLIAVGVALLVLGLVAATKGAEIVGVALLVWGLVKTRRVLRGVRLRGSIRGNEVGR